MEIVYWMITFLLSTWLLISLFIWAYWFFNPAERFCANHKYISAGIYIGAFFGCFIVIGSGVRYLLWFIPKGWTYETEEGDIRLVVFSIANFIGLCAAIFLMVLFNKIQKVRHENRDLCTEIKITREIKKKELDYLTVFLEEKCLKKAAVEFQKSLEALEELYKKSSLNPDQEIERRVLSELLNKILGELEDEEDEQEE